eukprot:CAMPEP_0168747596 /NCGR_PEP_ID=MMETSP0724-20121128/15741_1 /TAXON_ID=265536 /ORGANISM="Amphiprora sp., Strain CCMP467" /LENGTH=830 /DNA_ID=CAMNT_0008795397 /DNA_START=200 /DNA_END=2692 /DNA_ORIENTATION=-
MTTALGIIDFGRGPHAGDKHKVSPDFSASRPKSIASSGGGSAHSRTESSTETSVGYRYPPAEVSANENNQRIQSSLLQHQRSSSNPSSRQGSEIHLSGLGGAGGGSGSFAASQTSQKKIPQQRSKSVASNVSSKVDGGETVMIEERRRRAHGEGYTVHHYKRGRLLGKGGFAKVYLCTAMDTGKHYAIKIVPKANLVKERARTKLQTEIKIHRTLKHKNVCEYKHFFEDRDNCYILLELCHNQSLNEMIKRRKRLTEPEAAYFMDQMVQGVKYIHSLNVIHRDLKLGNLFLDKDLTIKVGDLGLATKLEDPEEKRKTICGTPNYIAPEVIQNDKSKRGHSFEVDIWSMGVVLYTILIGKPPYEAKDVKATYQRILNNQYTFPEHVPLSETAMDLIESMLQTNPHERPSLEYIMCHPFLSNRNMPPNLPMSSLHFAPSWIRTSDGVFVADENNNDGNSVRSSKSSKSQSSWGSRASSNSRRPFGRHDPNAVKPPFSSTVVNPKKAAGSASENKRPDVQRLVKQALGLGSKSKSPSPAFHIFEETGQSGLARESPRADIVEKTRTLSLSNQGHREASSLNTPRSQAIIMPTSDFDILKNMAKRLDTVLDIADSRRSTYRPQTPRATVGLSSPDKWVQRYVDYTSKYGLGFLLNDGTSGVCFNDSTKTSLEREGETFQYIERKRTAEGEAVRTEYDVSSFTLSDFPETLNKKVTLLKHFRNYLLEQQKKAKDEPTFEAAFAEGNPSDFVYIKKWIRTKHAILFRLSDQTIQIVFYDQTEILLTPDDQSITYVDKNRVRKTYFLTDELVGTFAELEKRIKYSRDIIHQLITTQR